MLFVTTIFSLVIGLAIAAPATSLSHSVHRREDWCDENLHNSASVETWNKYAKRTCEKIFSKPHDKPITLKLHIWAHSYHEGTPNPEPPKRWDYYHVYQFGLGGDVSKMTQHSCEYSFTDPEIQKRLREVNHVCTRENFDYVIAWSHDMEGQSYTAYVREAEHYPIDGPSPKPGWDFVSWQEKMTFWTEN
ncbi:hypothetical protein B0J11DRAFT_602677 [Dendryphion nanum]|uniref:Uncharacterized protein n=1 Tax=Dendryphion nanum TaxID=256645 RepID=A0A9P9E2Q8_9PLEO|nr:hypothetical protein B0J11DRAFT_602677 [Dendryphion nanum]